jgi:polyisoprenoid-binding protein YceI
VVLDLEIVGATTDAKGGHAGATATGTILRKDFGMSWNHTLDQGGVALSDEVQITIEVEGGTGGKKG